MKRKQASLLAALGLVVPAAAFPLGLGELRVNSALNEPLNARIGLVSPKPEELDELQVGLGSDEEFRRAGLERPHVLTKLRFAVVRGADGTPAIEVTTANPVREPYLNFLLEMNWSKGRLVREFTVLLDPPVYGARLKPPVRRPAAAAVAEPAPAPMPAEPPPLTGDTYGPTRQSDTLWAIARRIRPEGVSINQMMLALLRANPDAFVGGNINALKTGQVLRIPRPDGASDIPQAEALRQVQQQNAVWEEYRQGRIQHLTRAPIGAPTPAAAPAQPAAQPAAEPAQAQPRVELLAQAEGRAPAGAAAGDSTALRRDLDLTREELDSKRRETEELKSRVQELEDLVARQKTLLEVQSSELAGLQARAAQEAPAAEPGPAVLAPPPEPAVPPPAAEPVTAPVAEPATPPAAVEPPPPVEKPVEPVVVPPAQPERPEPSAAMEPPKAAPEPAVAPEPPKPEPPKPGPPKPESRPRPVLPPPVQPEKSFLDQLPADPATLGLGAAVLAALGGLFAFRRRRRAEVVQVQPVAAATPGPKPQAAVAVPASVAAGVVATAAVAEPAPVSVPPVEVPEKEDPLAEVNVYLAYERFDQAEKLVREAIAQYPGRHEYQLKLLEIDSAAKNVSAFERDAGVLRAAVGDDSPLMERAAGLWQELAPDRDLFAAGPADTQTLPPPEPGMQSPEAAVDFDLGFGAVEPAAAPVGAGLDLDLGEAASASQEIQPGIEFDITEPEPERGEATGPSDFELELAGPAEVPAAGAVSYEGGLDFDLGFGETPKGTTTQEVQATASLGFDQTVVEATEPVLDLSMEPEGFEERAAAAQGLDLAPQGPAEPASFDLGQELDFALEAEAPAAGIAPDLDLEPGETPSALQVAAAEEGLDLTLEPPPAAEAALDLGATEELEMERTMVEPGAEGGLDLDLGLAEAGAPETPPGAAQAAEIDFDFDLDLEEDEAKTLALGHAPAGDTDEVGTKLDLAQAYIDMGDVEGARGILTEVLAEGSEAQREEARLLMSRLQS